MTQTTTTPDVSGAGELSGGWGQFNDERLGPIKRYALRNPSLIVGLGLMFSLLLFVGIPNSSVFFLLPRDFLRL